MLLVRHRQMSRGVGQRCWGWAGEGGDGVVRQREEEAVKMCNLVEKGLRADKWRVD